MTPIDFEIDAPQALRGLQRALKELVDALPGGPATPTGVERALGIDRNLAWKVHRLVTTTDAAQAAGSVPGRVAMRILVTAAQGRAVPEGVVAGVVQAEDRYREMVRRHAGDPASAAIMLGAHPNAEGGPDLGLRRAAYRASSFLAGVRVRTQLSTFIVAPGDEPERIDVVSVKGFYEIERIRPGAPFVMTRPRAAVGNAAYATPMPYGAIEAPPAGTDLPLLGEFCSQPVPRFIAVTGDEGFVEDELEDRPVGKMGACTVVRATMARNLLPKYKSPGDENAEVSTRLRTPCQVVVLDKLVHEEAYGRVTPWVRVYNDLAGESAWVGERQSRYVVPVGERVENLGRGLGAIRTPDVPRYEAMLERLLARLGWEAERFMVYRVRIELPLVPSTVMLVHEQAER